MVDTTLNATPENRSQTATSFLKRYFQNRRSLVPVPIALALSLTLVYLAAGNFDPSDLVGGETDVQSVQSVRQEPCLANGEPPSSPGSVSGESASLPCETSNSNAKSPSPESIESWAYLWPRLKTRPPRG